MTNSYKVTLYLFWVKVALGNLLGGFYPKALKRNSITVLDARNPSHAGRRSHSFYDPVVGIVLILNDLSTILFNSRTRSGRMLLILNDLYVKRLKSHESVLSSPQPG